MDESQGRSFSSPRSDRHHVSSKQRCLWSLFSRGALPFHVSLCQQREMVE